MGLCVHVKDVGTGKVYRILQGQESKNILEFHLASFFFLSFLFYELCKFIICLNRKHGHTVRIVHFLQTFFYLRYNGDYYFSQIHIQLPLV